MFYLSKFSLKSSKVFMPPYCTASTPQNYLLNLTWLQ